MKAGDFVLAAFLLAGLLSDVFAADVYLLGGQSNMQGIGKIADLPDGYSEGMPVPNTFFWNGKSFEPLVLGRTKTSGRVGEFGPELGFALKMAAAERPVYLIKYHAGGQPLHHGWNGNRWVGGEPAPGRRNFYPGEELGDESRGKLYAAMLARFKAGIASLDAPQVRGFIWMQGEQDSKNETSATTYAVSLRRLRDRLAEDLCLEYPLPLAFGQVLPHEPALERFTHRAEIRAQMVLAGESTEHAAMVPTDGFGLHKDTVHYNAAGQLRLGRAFAEAIKDLHQEGQPF